MMKYSMTLKPGVTGDTQIMRRSGRGISNGEEIRIKIHLKPIPTLMNAMRSADVLTKQESRAVVERSDVCVVPAGGVVGEAMLAMVLASAFLEKFGGDSMRETENNYAHFCGMMEEY